MSCNNLSKRSDAQARSGHIQVAAFGHVKYDISSSNMIDLHSYNFDALIFDCDGTLVDTAALHYYTYATALAKYRLPMEQHWYRARTGLTPAALLATYETEVSPLPVSHESIMRDVTESFQDNLHMLREVGIIADIARTWKGRVPMGVASNGERKNVIASLKTAGLLDLFDIIVTVDDVNTGKPAPDVYLESARRLGVQPERCLVFEDSDEGLIAARSAGMTTIDGRDFF
jgi:beta-phosphoglucomutase-like phosphatase (HAD superfamily)